MKVGQRSNGKGERGNKKKKKKRDQEQEERERNVKKIQERRETIKSEKG